ncbi:DMT family transporter [Flexivirga sp. ID2601S]|uniref:DMT family transporter n=1 Tax=Flexivirga aerilata TaxID=1656889 RepID=A0A849AIW6_9MICO|nr:DMT family transporter [Flexivirga aerilata]NNG39913.1 DMT family transporter [Flexivirga aerilata]
MGVVFALASSLVWGTADFFGGLFTKRIVALRVVVLSQCGGLIAMSLLMIVEVARNGWSGGPWWLWGGLSGLVGGLGLCSFYAALSSGVMGVVSPIAALGAVVPVALGLLTGDRLGLVVGLGLALALAGAALASGPELSGAASRRSVLLAVAAAIGLGLSLYFLHQASGHGVVPSLWAMRVASVSELALVWWCWPGGVPGGRAQARVIPLLMLVGCGDLAANGLFALASRHGAVSVVSVLGSLYPVATLVLARVFLHERLRPVQLVGVALALVGVILAVS